MGSVMEQKADAKRVQNMANAMCEVVDQVKRIHEKLVESSQRAEAMSAKVEQMSERISDAHRRIEGVGCQLEHGSLQQQHAAQSLQTSTERYRHDMDQMSKALMETQTNLQARDQGLMSWQRPFL